MASFRKRVGGWRAVVAILRTRECKTFSTEAEAWASERETEVRRGADSGMVVGKNCGDAFDRYPWPHALANTPLANYAIGIAPWSSRLPAAAARRVSPRSHSAMR